MSELKQLHLAFPKFKKGKSTTDRVATITRQHVNKNGEIVPTTKFKVVTTPINPSTLEGIDVTPHLKRGNAFLGYYIQGIKETMFYVDTVIDPTQEEHPWFQASLAPEHIWPELNPTTTGKKDGYVFRMGLPLWIQLNEANNRKNPFFRIRVQTKNFDELPNMKNSRTAHASIEGYMNNPLSQLQLLGFNGRCKGQTWNPVLKQLGVTNLALKQYFSTLIEEQCEHYPPKQTQMREALSEIADLF